MVTKKAEAKTTKSVPAKPLPSKSQGRSSLALNRKNELIGDIQSTLDLREVTLKHKGVIRITDNDLVECIHLPDGEFSSVVIADLPNLKEIYACGMAPTWMDCRYLPNLRTLVIDGGARWLHVEQAGNLSDIDVGKCEQLGYLSIQQAPMLSRVNIEQCRLLPSIHGVSTEDQDRLGLTRQLGVLQAMSKRDSTAYPRMTCADIDLLLGNIRRGEVLLKKLFPNEDEEIDALSAPPSYSYRLLQPEESVYTGGTGESYCYAFEVTTQETKGKKQVTNYLEERGIHEPEAAIGEALRRVVSGLGLAKGVAPSEDQLLTYLNLLLSAPDGDPVSWIKTDDVSLRLSLAGNPLMPKRAFQQLASDAVPEVRMELAENPAASIEVRQSILHGLISEADLAIRRRVAKSPVVTTDDLVVLSKDQDIGVLSTLAENPFLPSEARARIFEVLARCSELDGQLLVARSLNVRAEVFSILLACSDQSVIVAVSENIDAPDGARAKALEKLAASDDHSVKLSVARNKLTPPQVLDVLGKSTDVTVMEAVAYNSSTPPATLRSLAQSPNPCLQCGVAGNIAAPTEALHSLAKCKDPIWGESIRNSVAGNPSAPPVALDILVKDKEWQTRAMIAGNPSASQVLLALLASDKEYSVREAVARNPKTAKSVLKVLSIDKSDNIRMYVARHLGAPVQVLESLAGDSSFAVRRDVASNSSTAHSVLQVLLKDVITEVRQTAEVALTRGESLMEGAEINRQTPGRLANE